MCFQSKRQASPDVEEVGPENQRDEKLKAQNKMVDDGENRRRRNFHREFEIKKDLMNAMINSIEEMKTSWQKQIDQLAQTLEKRILQVECYDDEVDSEMFTNNVDDNMEEDEHIQLHLTNTERQESGKALRVLEEEKRF